MLVTIVHTDLALKLIFIRFPASFILSVIYDYEPKGKDDHLLHLMRKYLELIATNLEPATTAVMETFPFRMFTHAVLSSGLESYDLLVLQLPVWFPGAAFKRASVECLKAGHDVKEIPFHYVKEMTVSHTTRSIEKTD